MDGQGRPAVRGRLKKYLKDCDLSGIFEHLLLELLELLFRSFSFPSFSSPSTRDPRTARSRDQSVWIWPRFSKICWSWSGSRFSISFWIDRFWSVNPCLHRFLRQSKLIFSEMLDFLDFDFFDFRPEFPKSIYAESRWLSLNLRLVDLVIFSGIVVVISY